jgi:hypothetical protein
VVAALLARGGEGALYDLVRFFSFHFSIFSSQLIPLSPTHDRRPNTHACTRPHQIVRFRRAFLAGVQPAFLPAGWSVEHGLPGLGLA